MINIALQHVVSELNTYFGLRTGAAADSNVVAASLFDVDGNVNSAAQNKVVMSMVNLEQDAVYKPLESFRTLPDGSSERLKPEININLYILFIANLSSYFEAMKSLTNVISFFQLNPYFDYKSISGLENIRGRLSFELFSMTFEQQNNLWGVLGAKYMPSVVYKVGMLEVRDDQVEGIAPPVKEIHIEGEGV
ncbi:MAG: hypothetical protein Alis3KO_04980 [Aliiglaciecola sp.]|uniref:DUF4255 domain-containing protein n=1 Tax=Aliiglaciecola sp. M165 TaxID=2593649 RepID=UPI00163DE08B|nr:DUF4255 domain-containing protein [Aliiglaciecola sp. M165]